MVLLLWVADSYDQILLHKLCRKFVTTFAAEGETNNESETISESGEDVFKRFFGLRYSPYTRHWGDPNFSEKYKWIDLFEAAKAEEASIRDEAGPSGHPTTPVKPAVDLPVFTSGSGRKPRPNRQLGMQFGANRIRTDKPATES